MTGFSLTPMADMPPETPEQFPNFVQFQFNGVNLGGPDATVLNIVGTGFVLERDGDTVTLTLS